MNKGIKWGGVIVLVLLCLNCKKPGFSAQEKERILSQKGQIMRICTVDRQEDSLFLRQEALKLTDTELNSPYYSILKKGLLATVQDSSNPGVGIAAPQVGISRCLILVQRFDKAGEPFEAYINPEIVYYSPARITGRLFVYSRYRGKCQSFGDYRYKLFGGNVRAGKTGYRKRIYGCHLST